MRFSTQKNRPNELKLIDKNILLPYNYQLSKNIVHESKFGGIVDSKIDENRCKQTPASLH